MFYPQKGNKSVENHNNVLYLSPTDKMYPINYNIEGNVGLGPNNLNINLYTKDVKDQTYHKDRIDVGDIGQGITNCIGEVLRRNSYYKGLVL